MYSTSTPSLSPFEERLQSPSTPIVPARIFMTSVTSVPAGITSSPWVLFAVLRSSAISASYGLRVSSYFGRGAVRCCGRGVSFRVSSLADCAGGMVRPVWQHLTNECAEIGWFDHAEISRAIFYRVLPRIWCSAGKPAHGRLTRGKIEPMHGCDYVYDASDLARHALALSLQAMLNSSVIVGDGFERADQNDVEPACAL